MMAVMESHARPRPDHVDLCIIGSGSGLSLIDDDIDDWQIALLDNGVGPTQIFGGTCLNAGCIPTKMLALPADVCRTPELGARVNVAVDPGPLDVSYQFALRASADTWRNFGVPVPAPMYHGIWSASFQRDLKLEGDILVLMQNLRCFTRQFELLRTVGVPV